MFLTSDQPEFDALLTTTATWLLAGSAAWALLICVAALLETATSGRLRATSWVGCPKPLRGALLAALGAVLVASPGHAASTRERELPVPARPLGSVPTSASASRPIVVRPGDTLWALARSRLPDTAGVAAICSQVARLHHRNRAVIGPDPDLLRPGQRLVPVLGSPRIRKENP